MHPDHPRAARRVDGQQAGPLQAVQRALGAPRVARGHGGCPGNELARGRGGEHRLRDAVPAQQHGQGQAGLGRAVRRELVGTLHRQHPGDHLGAGRGAGHPGQLVPLPDEQVAVVPAGQPGAGDGRAGLEQGQRVTAQVLDQVDRAKPLVRVGGQAPHQVGQRLVRAERAHREQGRLAGRRDGALGGRGDKYLARRAGRPQPVQVGRPGHVVQHHQPGPAGLGQPGQEPGRDRLAVAGRGHPGPLRERPDVAGQHGGPAAGRHPDQQAVRALAAPGLRQVHGQLGLTGAARPVRGRPGRRGEHQ
jgi:hypothetical protein